MASAGLQRIFADRYRADRLVTDAGRVALYRGTNVVLDRPVMIKIGSARDTNGDDFAIEAKQVSQVLHPNVLPLWDFGTETDGTFFTVYEDFDGLPLDRLLSDRGQLPVDLSLAIVQGIAAGVSASGIRGGLRPANSLVQETGPQSANVKVFNFTPVATSVDAEEQNFIAPELNDRADPDERSDVYSLGITLYRMLAGAVPFAESSAAEVIPRSAAEPPPPLSAFRSDLPQNIETVILKAMSRDPEMRQQTLAQFSDELTAGAVGLGAVTTVSTSNIWKTAFVVLAGITLLAAALIYATSVKQTNPSTLQVDANGQPVQPINPATGLAEQNLSNMQGMTAFDVNSNANLAMPATLPGGDGYDPWARGGMPPPGAPPGQTVTIDPNNPSPFMPSDVGCVMQPSGIMLCPVPLTNVNAAPAQPTPLPRRGAANANANLQSVPANQAAPPETRPSQPAANAAANRPSTRRTPAANTAAPPPSSNRPDESN